MKILETKFTSHREKDILEAVAFLKDKHGKRYTERKLTGITPVNIERKKMKELYIVDLTTPANQENTTKAQTVGQ